MMRSHRLISVLLLLCGPVLFVANISRAKNTNSPQSFYAVTEFFSDNLSDSYEEILDVEPQGKDVQVRLIHITSATQFCGGSLLRVVERTLPNTTVQKVVGRKVCSVTGQEVDAALKAAAPKVIESIFETDTVDLVPQCGTRQDVLAFPHPQDVEEKVLHRNSPRVEALWDLSYHIRRRVFGKYFSFRNLSSAQEKESEELEVKLLPELISGKYDAAFNQNACNGKKCEPNYLAWELSGYKIPTTQDPSTVELVNVSSLHLLNYERPQYPAIAGMAHISGEVRLRLFPDPATGAVKEVQFISGNQLLRSSAVDTAKKWRFSPGTQSGAPVEVVLKFSLCANM
ncbi:MAG: energy transducer TonB [Candidatus Acidiferrales bacterium]